MPYTFMVGTDTGGAFKTTTVIELGAVLGLRGKKTALIGFDENSELSAYLGINVDKLECSTADIFRSSQNFESLLVHLPKDVIGSDNVFLAPSSPELIVSVQEAKGKSKSVFLKNYITRHLADFDFVLIDTPPGLNLLKINGIEAADFIVIPCKYDNKTTIAARRFLEQVKEIKGPNFDEYGILVSGVDLRRSKAIKDSRVILEPYTKNDEIFITEIPTDIMIERSKNYDLCQSVQVFKPDSRGAEAFRKLGREIYKYF